MITVVGGTYDELCFEPYWKGKYGSGLRACCALNQLQPSTTIKYYTFCDNETEKYLKYLPFIDAAPTIIQSTVQFYYDHPLINPRIFPRPDTIDKGANHLNVSAEQILCYGFLEGTASVVGEKVVYDPQSPVNPILFSQSNSKANQLAYVVNINEARILAQTEDIHEIKKFFFEWPYRNQLLITLASMKAISLGVNELMVGSVSSDGFHKDGTAIFFSLVNDLLKYQEGSISITAPAIGLTSLQLVKRSGIRPDVLYYAHSCHTGNLPCGHCRGCYKYMDVIENLRNDGWEKS